MELDINVSIGKNNLERMNKNKHIRLTLLVLDSFVVLNFDLILKV